LVGNNVSKMIYFVSGEM